MADVFHHGLRLLEHIFVERILNPMLVSHNVPSLGTCRARRPIVGGGGRSMRLLWTGNFEIETPAAFHPLSAGAGIGEATRRDAAPPVPHHARRFRLRL